MKLENGKLVDYNYEDIKKIVLEAVRRWTKEGQYDLINTLVDEMGKTHGEELGKRFVK